MTNELIVAPKRTQNEIVSQNQAIIDLKSQVFQPNIDFGPPYPGSDKPTLLKPGAEKIASLFGLRPNYIERSMVERWDLDDPLFHYRYECQLIDIASGMVVGSGIGSCNSREDKYGWRWVSEAAVPPQYDKSKLRARGGKISEFAFAIDAAETGGKYGKPAEYWQKFQDAIQNGTARKFKKLTAKGSEYDAFEIDALEYRVPNDDVFSLVNTLDKMAQKRALIAAILVATGASAFFTQDVEDFAGYAAHVVADDVVEGTYTVQEGTEKAGHKTATEPPAHAEQHTEPPQAARPAKAKKPAPLDDAALLRGATIPAFVGWVLDESPDLEPGDTMTAGKRALERLGLKRWEEAAELTVGAAKERYTAAELGATVSES